MFSKFITLAVCTLISSVAFASEPAPKAPRCAVAKSTEITQTVDGRTVIRVKTIQVCK